MLEARTVTLRRANHTIVDGVSLAVRPGQVTVIIGPDGAGKSMLLRMLSGELRPTSGDIELDRRAIETYSPAELGSRRAIVPQSSMLTFDFTALEVVLLGATVPGFAPP